jgi:hypothetical protein
MGSYDRAMQFFQRVRVTRRTLTGTHCRCSCICSQALEIRVLRLGENDANTARTRGSMGYTKLLMGDPDGARESLQMCLDVLQRTLPERHPDMLRFKQWLEECDRPNPVPATDDQQEEL